MISNLFVAKSRALLRDPPHKSFIDVKRYKDAAKEFMEKILGGVEPLSIGLDGELEKIVERADAVASPFDRWFLDLVYTSDSAISFNRLLNIINPYYKSDAISYSGDIEREALGVAEEINKILRVVTETVSHSNDRARIAYMTLYTLLETTWISKGLPISLADARVPTHTIFDYVYALATAVNVTLYEEPSGYLVRVDIPSVQKFIGGARKAGDFWAGSWIISNLMWRTIEPLITSYGPDILITPSPRLNPYLFLTTIKTIEEATNENTIDKNVTQVLSDICKIYSKALEGIEPGLGGLLNVVGAERGKTTHCERFRRVFGLIPLIPATAYIILPKVYLDNENVVRNTIVENYRKAWTSLLHDVETKLGRYSREGGGGESWVYEVSYKLLKFFENSLSSPHIGIRVDVVDLRNIYEKLNECLKNVDRNCLEIGLSRDVVKRIIEIVKKVNLTHPQPAMKLLWSVALDNALKKVSMYTPLPMPRPFWVTDEKSHLMEPTIDYETLAKSGDNWKVCSLDGEEPAIIYLGKTFNGPAEDYDDGMVNELIDKLNINELMNRLNINKNIFKDKFLRPLIRPGEALGPYCLLKRFVYKAYSEELKDVMKLVSTDDVALLKFNDAIAKAAPKLIDTVIDKLCKNLNQDCDLVEKIIKSFVFYKDRDESIERDLVLAAQFLNMSYTEFVSVMNKSLRECCKKYNDLHQLVKELLKEYRDYIDVEKIVSKADVSALSNLCSLRTSYAIVKADADNMGLIISGDLSPLGLTVKDYFEAIFKAIAEEARIFSGDKEVRDEERSRVLRRLEEIFNNIAELVSSLSGSNSKILISPAYSYAVSTALIISALRDIILTLRYRGFPVYSGGDDLLALLPVDTVLAYVFKSRERFNGDEMFYYLNHGNARTPIAHAIPTGRSYSIRYAQLMDVMSSEIYETIELLENKAKESKWCKAACKDNESGKEVCRDKDTVVISDSRGGIIAILPLTLKSCDNIAIQPKDMARITSLLYTMVKTGILSTGVPEDLESRIRSIVSGEVDKEILQGLEKSLDKIVKYIIGRNVDKKHAGFAEDVTNMMIKVRDVQANDGLHLMLHLFNVLKIVRRHP